MNSLTIVTLKLHEQTNCWYSLIEQSGGTRYFRAFMKRLKPKHIIPFSCFVAVVISTAAALAQSWNNAPLNPRSVAAQSNSLIDLLALMSGKCTTLTVADRDFACKVVAYAHEENGRVSFAVAIDDPTDENHVVSFSGENGKRADDNSYELPIDRILLNSKNRPKVDGLPVPAEQNSTGVCRQTGNFAAKKVNEIICSATDTAGRSYKLLFVSDGTPVSVRRIRQSVPSIQDPFK
jgi:hypothetical protein